MCMSPIFRFVWWSWQQFLSQFPWNQWPWHQALSTSLHTVSITEHVWRRKRRRRGMDTTGYYTRILPGYYLDTTGSSWTRSNTINHWYNGERREGGREGRRGLERRCTCIHSFFPQLGLLKDIELAPPTGSHDNLITLEIESDALSQ